MGTMTGIQPPLVPLYHPNERFEISAHGLDDWQRSECFKRTRDATMGDDVATVAGKVGFFEAQRLRRPLIRQILGGWRFAWGGLLMLFVVVGMVAGFSQSRLPVDDDLANAALWIGSMATVVACVFGLNRFIVNKLRQSWYARGIPAEVGITYSIAPDGLRMGSETGKTVIHWPYLSEIVLVGNYWMLVAAGMGIALPRRLFATPVEERAFLSGILAHMSPAARVRSQKADTFLSSPGTT
jgi:hypothetical protein